jgi:hypothetical protein
LTNGDIIGGKVVSLSEDQLVLESENFGEMKIPRDKIEIIGLGDQSIQTTIDRAVAEKVASRVGNDGASLPSGPTGPPAASNSLPSLQNAAVQNQIDSLLQKALGGEMGIGNLQQNADQTRRGLEDLQRDLGPGSGAEALDGYIRIFELFGSGGAAPKQPKQDKQ